MMKKWTMFMAGVVVMGGLDRMVMGQRPQKLGGKSQQRVLEVEADTFKRGWVVRDARRQKIFVDIAGEKIDLPAKAKLLKISELEKEFAKQQRDVRDDDDDRTAKYVELFPWGQDRQLYEAVEKLADKLLRRNPANPDPTARKAKDWAQEQLEQMRKTRTAGLEEGEWTMDRVQQIRFALIGTGAYKGSNPQISFRRNVLDRFFEEMAQIDKFTSKEEQRDFRRLPSIDQARIIKRETGDKYQPDIVINRDPRLVIDFRTRIQPLLARSCAQSSCHGGQNVKFQLMTRPVSIPQVYANFYTLDTYQAKDGDVIDHVRPAIDSLLINYFVPVDLAPRGLTHNPPIQPVIRSREDARYRQVVDWLRIQPKEPLDVLLGEREGTKPPVAIGSETVRPAEEQGREKP